MSEHDCYAWSAAAPGLPYRCVHCRKEYARPEVPDWRAIAEELAGALAAFARQRGYPRSHHLGCLCEGQDGDGTTCLSRQDAARAALARFEAAERKP